MRYLRHLNLPENRTNPDVLPVSLKRDDNWVVLMKEGVKEETEPVVEEINNRRVKVKKVLKTILIVLGVATFLVLGYYFFRDFLKPNFYNYKIY